MAHKTLKTVAELATTKAEAMTPTEALQLEFKRRIAKRVDPIAEQKPAGSIREALARWLEEEL